MELPVLICGAGPAGSACAWKLAREGVDCLVLDRLSFPRQKVCAGALGARGAGIMLRSGILSAGELERLTLASHSTMSCWLGYRRLRTHSPQGPPVRIVDRPGLDSLLLQRAREAGAGLVPGEGVEGLAEGRVRTSSGRTRGWAGLVGADGAGSLVARWLGLQRPAHRPGLGVQAVVAGKAAKAHGLQIHFGLVPWGYGWVFPRDGDSLVGIGGTGGAFRGGGMARVMPGLLRHAGGRGNEPLRGAPIASGPVAPRLGRGRVYLAGEAAGLVDRISGEGISHAVESGLLVAEALLRGGDRGWLARRARRGCAGLVRQSRLLAGLLYHRALQPRAMRRLRDDPRFFQGYWDLVAGRVSYWRMMLRFLLPPT
jgi:flavin-dependent dehydrogenase